MKDVNNAVHALSNEYTDDNDDCNSEQTYSKMIENCQKRTSSVQKLKEDLKLYKGGKTCNLTNSLCTEQCNDRN